MQWLLPPSLLPRSCRFWRLHRMQQRSAPLCYRDWVCSCASAQKCETLVDRTPWGIPKLLFGDPPGLLTKDKSRYTDVVLCCGGLMQFNWTVRFVGILI